MYDELFGIDVDGKSVFIELDIFVAHVYETTISDYTLDRSNPSPLPRNSR